jgi:7-carboxy-7-deazaguanine synthase
MDNKLNISEIFCSFQGESTLVGRNTLFIRTSCCNLSCSMCDTRYSFKKNKQIKIRDLCKIIKTVGYKYICITGGEPLLQIKEINTLIKAILPVGVTISIETNGSLPINKINKKVKRVLDVKTPSTNEEGSFLLSNLKELTKNDEVKFFISKRKDFDYAVSFINRYRPKGTILFSPDLKNKELTKKISSWILASGKDIVFQPQLHKLIKERPIYIIAPKH